MQDPCSAEENARIVQLVLATRQRVPGTEARIREAVRSFADQDKLRQLNVLWAVFLPETIIDTAFASELLACAIERGNLPLFYDMLCYMTDATDATPARQLDIVTMLLNKYGNAGQFAAELLDLQQSLAQLRPQRQRKVPTRFRPT